MNSRPDSWRWKRKGLHWAVWLLLAAVAQACLRPVEGDFPNTGQGLADDELLWVLRIPVSPSEAGLAGSLSMRDSISFSNYNKPFFEDFVPQLVKRILNGEVTAYEEYPAQTKVTNPRERLIQMGGTAQNIDPLLKLAELYVVVNTSRRIYLGLPVFLRLVWRDPAGREADRGFVGIDLDSEGSGEFLLGESFRSEFAKIESYFAMPVYLRTNFREYAIRSLEEARYVQNMVYEGRWSEIAWENEGINISGKQRVRIDPESVVPLAGFYRFKVGGEEDSTSYAELNLTAEDDYLVADWSNRFQVEKILPYGRWQFFSNSGDLYWFEVVQDSALALFVVQGRDTLGSYQNPVY